MRGRPKGTTKGFRYPKFYDKYMEKKAEREEFERKKDKA